MPSKLLALFLSWTSAWSVFSRSCPSKFPCLKLKGLVFWNKRLTYLYNPTPTQCTDEFLWQHCLFSPQIDHVLHCLGWFFSYQNFVVLLTVPWLCWRQFCLQKRTCWNTIINVSSVIGWTLCDHVFVWRRARKWLCVPCKSIKSVNPWRSWPCERLGPKPALFRHGGGFRGGNPELSFVEWINWTACA